MTILKTVTKTALALPAAWIGYSKIGIPHDLPLPAALSAEIQTTPLPNAGQVAYYADTSGSGTPIVLIHSINAAASAKEMQPLFDHYRGKRPIYALDLPGYGHSNRANRTYTPIFFADVIRNFIDGVVGESADVIALSLGCEFAARAAHQAPALFNTLTFISPTGFTGAGTEGNSEGASRSGNSNRAYDVLAFPLWSQALYDLIASKPSIRYFLQKSFVNEPPQELLDYGYLTAHQPNAKNVPLYFLSGQLFTRDIAQTIYPELTLPVHILFDTDPYVNFEQLPLFVTDNPNWVATRIHGTQGLPHWEKSAETTTAITTFWQQ